jgi:hypothetical protein
MQSLAPDRQKRSLTPSDSNVPLKPLDRRALHVPIRKKS